MPVDKIRRVLEPGTACELQGDERRAGRGGRREPVLDARENGAIQFEHRVVALAADLYIPIIGVGEHDLVGPGVRAGRLHNPHRAGGGLHQIGIVPAPAGQHIIAKVGDQDILAVAAAQRIVSGLANQEIIVAAAVNHVVAVATLNCIDPGVAAEGVSLLRTRQMFDIRQNVAGGVAPDLRAIAFKIHIDADRRGEIAGDILRAIATIDRIGSFATDQDVRTDMSKEA